MFLSVYPFTDKCKWTRSVTVTGIQLFLDVHKSNFIVDTNNLIVNWLAVCIPLEIKECS